MGAIRLRIEILDGLADAEPGPHGVHPPRLVEDAIDGSPQAVQIKGGSLVEGGDCLGEIHGVVIVVATRNQ